MTKSILVTTDFSDVSYASFEVAAELAKALGAKIKFLAVVEDPVLASTMYMVEPTYIVPSPEIRKKVFDRAAEKMKELAKEHFHGFEVEITVREMVESAHHDINEFARKHEVDYIVMATHGRTGFKRLFVGSVCDRVVRSAPCPVIAVPAGVHHHHEKKEE